MIPRTLSAFISQNDRVEIGKQENKRNGPTDNVLLHSSRKEKREKEQLKQWGDRQANYYLLK